MKSKFFPVVLVVIMISFFTTGCLVTREHRPYPRQQVHVHRTHGHDRYDHDRYSRNDHYDNHGSSRSRY